MSLHVRWTDEAQETFEITVNVIEIKWGFKSAQKFVKSVNATINIISTHPYIFKASVTTNFRKAFITRQTSMFYEVQDTEILIHYFWDNRQEPFFD